MLVCLSAELVQSQLVCFLFWGYVFDSTGPFCDLSSKNQLVVSDMVFYILISCVWFLSSQNHMQSPLLVFCQCQRILIVHPQSLLLSISEQVDLQPLPATSSQPPHHSTKNVVLIVGPEEEIFPWGGEWALDEWLSVQGLTVQILEAQGSLLLSGRVWRLRC